MHLCKDVIYCSVVYLGEGVPATLCNHGCRDGGVVKYHPFVHYRDIHVNKVNDTLHIAAADSRL